MTELGAVIIFLLLLLFELPYILFKPNKRYPKPLTDPKPNSEEATKKYVERNE